MDRKLIPGLQVGRQRRLRFLQGEDDDLGGSFVRLTDVFSQIPFPVVTRGGGKEKSRFYCHFTRVLFFSHLRSPTLLLSFVLSLCSFLRSLTLFFAPFCHFVLSFFLFLVPSNFFPCSFKFLSLFLQISSLVPSNFFPCSFKFLPLFLASFVFFSPFFTRFFLTILPLFFFLPTFFFLQLSLVLPFTFFLFSTFPLFSQHFVSLLAPLGFTLLVIPYLVHSFFLPFPSSIFAPLSFFFFLPFTFLL